MTAYRLLFDRVLTRTDAEWAHHAAFRAIRAARPLTQVLTPRRTAVTAMGIDFPEVLGVAAGFDKNAVGIDALAALGFGFVEVGTVTAEPQPGNPRPRLVRLPADRAVVNRMGFNNDGAEVVARRLAGRSFAVPVGVNIGKTKVVPEDAAVADYEKSTTLLAPHADYLVVNVSSPNTPGLRDLQAVEKLEPLLRAVRRRADDVVDDPPATAGQDRTGPRRRRRARGRRPGRGHRPRRCGGHQHHDRARAGSRRPPRTWPRPVRADSRAHRCASGPTRSCGCCAAGSARR